MPQQPESTSVTSAPVRRSARRLGSVPIRAF